MRSWLQLAEYFLFSFCLFAVVKASQNAGDPGLTEIKAYTLCTDKCQGKPEGLYPLCSSCRQFALCSRDVMHRFDCPSGKNYDVMKGACLPSNQTECRRTRHVMTRRRASRRALESVELEGLGSQTQSSRCISSCWDRPDGSYQSCASCSVYARCILGTLFDRLPCPWGQVWDDTSKRCQTWSTTCRSPQVPSPVPTWVGECVSSCWGVPDGRYPSCRGCHVFALCQAGRLLDGLPCPPGLVWDQNDQSCDVLSTTCEDSPLTVTASRIPLGNGGAIYCTTTVPPQPTRPSVATTIAPLPSTQQPPTTTAETTVTSTPAALTGTSVPITTASTTTAATTAATTTAATTAATTTAATTVATTTAATTAATTTAATTAATTTAATTAATTTAATTVATTAATTTAATTTAATTTAATTTAATTTAATTIVATTTAATTTASTTTPATTTAATTTAATTVATTTAATTTAATTTAATTTAATTTAATTAATTNTSTTTAATTTAATTTAATTTAATTTAATTTAATTTAATTTAATTTAATTTAATTTAATTAATTTTSTTTAATTTAATTTSATTTAATTTAATTTAATTTAATTTAATTPAATTAQWCYAESDCSTLGTGNFHVCDTCSNYLQCVAGTFSGIAGCTNLGEFDASQNACVADSSTCQLTE